MAYNNMSKYHEDSDADDEFERTAWQQRDQIPVEYESSPTSSGPLSTEHTPTTFTHSRDSRISPTGLIVDWSAEQVADFVSDLGFEQYCDTFVDEGITGDVLVSLQHAELKEMGVGSVGHRLSILKAVYEIKVKQNVPIDPDDYVPLSAETSAQDAPPTQDDFAKVIRVVQARDERIHTAESELRHLREDLSRVIDENKRLRDEILPLVRMLKEQQQTLPSLPTTHEHVTSPPATADTRTGSSLSRKFSTKKLFLGSAPKNPSPTIQEHRALVDHSSLDPSAAAVAASSHLTASLGTGAQMSPNSIAQPSPTSPAYTQGRTQYARPEIPRSHQDHDNTQSWAYSDQVAANRDPRATPGLPSARSMGRSAPTPTPDDRDRDPPLSGGSTSNNLQPSSSSQQAPSSNPQVEIFKSFRVSIDDPCHKVLPVALKKYNITADWRQYALYIVHGDQERCLGLNERPLILFKQLDKEGRKPMFMLRKHAAPEQGHVSTVGGNDVRAVPPNSGFGWDSQSRGTPLPGGVL
ncbi:Adaptor for signal transduction [Curvularia kusanoi]|uniref:Adaptor for signal transduction n=1 Tax=Curvularia kusanoi TaxID=90978 RepID=A0A9P4TAV3_CURKU|nr:Adaptor for signal transduction [Curvularia kusanoi]